MAVTFPKLRVGEPARHEALSVFPLFSNSTGAIEYRLSDEALADESVLVREISEGGSVPTLLVENTGDVRVLFLEGEELVGAKQNRVLNTSVLVGAHTKIEIPVSCVEQGRWHYKSRSFESSGSHSPVSLRQTLKASVSRSVKEKRGHTSDQGAVWKTVSFLHMAHGVHSDTAAMSDVFANYQDQIAIFREKLKYSKGATGMAMAIGKQIVSLDVFDKPATCQKVWDRMLSGIVFDALQAGHTDEFANVADAHRLLATASDLRWEQTETVGEGDEYRAESEQGEHGSALTFLGVVVHESFLAPV